MRKPLPGSYGADTENADDDVSLDERLRVLMSGQ